MAMIVANPEVVAPLRMDVMWGGDPVEASNLAKRRKTQVESHRNISPTTTLEGQNSFAHPTTTQDCHAKQATQENQNMHRLDKREGQGRQDDSTRYFNSPLNHFDSDTNVGSPDWQHTYPSRELHSQFVSPCLTSGALNGMRAVSPIWSPQPPHSPAISTNLPEPNDTNFCNSAVSTGVHSHCQCFDDASPYSSHSPHSFNAVHKMAATDFIGEMGLNLTTHLALAGGTSKAPRFLRSGAKDVLQKWAMRNLDNPYPSPQTKKILQDLTKLTTSQIDNWFMNFRKRLWKPAIEQLVQSGQLDSSETVMSSYQKHTARGGEVRSLTLPENTGIGGFSGSDNEYAECGESPQVPLHETGPHVNFPSFEPHRNSLTSKVSCDGPMVRHLLPSYGLPDHHESFVGPDQRNVFPQDDDRVPFEPVNGVGFPPNVPSSQLNHGHDSPHSSSGVCTSVVPAPDRDIGIPHVATPATGLDSEKQSHSQSLRHHGQRWVTASPSQESWRLTDASSHSSLTSPSADIHCNQIWLATTTNGSVAPKSPPTIGQDHSKWNNGGHTGTLEAHHHVTNVDLRTPTNTSPILIKSLDDFDAVDVVGCTVEEKGKIPLSDLRLPHAPQSLYSPLDFNPPQSPLELHPWVSKDEPKRAPQQDEGRCDPIAFNDQRPSDQRNANDDPHLSSNSCSPATITHLVEAPEEGNGVMEATSDYTSGGTGVRLGRPARVISQLAHPICEVSM